jgi:GABA permease
VIFSPIGAVLVAAALVFALAINPPALAWIWFAIVSIIVLGLGALAPLAFERTRVSPQRPAVAVDPERRLLVIADPHGSEAALRDEILARLDGAVAVHLVVPVRVSHLHFLTDDESAERRQAEESLSISVGLLRQRGISATGSVGSDKPLESMTDALGSFPATQVLLATPPAADAYWLERGLPAKARALTQVPVTHVVVPSSTSAGQRPEARGAVRL